MKIAELVLILMLIYMPCRLLFVFIGIVSFFFRLYVSFLLFLYSLMFQNCLFLFLLSHIYTFNRRVSSIRLSGYLVCEWKDGVQLS